MIAPKKIRIGELLVQNRLISEKQLETALELQKKNMGKSSAILWWSSPS